MYHCYHLQSNLSKKKSEYLLRCYTSYTGFTLILLFFVTIAYDWSTGNGNTNNLYPTLRVRVIVMGVV